MHLQITKYWPEFSLNGKGDVGLKLCDLLRHEGGLAWINKNFSWEDFSTENIKKNVVGKAIEEDTLRFPPYSSRREYHSRKLTLEGAASG